MSKGEVNLIRMFDYISPQFLLGDLNVVAPDWGGIDNIYDFYKFYYLLDGEAVITMLGETFKPQPGELIVIPPFTKHSYTQNPLHPVYLYWCHLELSSRLNNLLIYSKNTVKSVPDKETIITLFDMLLCNAKDNSLINILTRKACMLQLFALHLQNIDINQLNFQSNNTFYNTITEYILKNMNETIHIDDLADIVHLHPNYFISIFKHHFHVSPNKYINILRLEKAANLLHSDSYKNIQEIAHECGIHDYRYFGRIFKKRYGITPSQFRTAKVISENRD